jgi:hypothetical protein
MRLSGFEMVRRRRRDEVHARDEAGSRPNQTLQLTTTALRTQLLVDSWVSIDEEGRFY